MFSASGFDKPVARLFERAAADHIFEDLKFEILKGGAIDRERLTEIGRQRLNSFGGELKSRLEVGVHERTEVDERYLAEISGVTFAIDPNFVPLLRDYRLTFEGGRFTLRSTDNAAHSLLSIATRR